MTLIAHSLNDKVPFIVGDILLSATYKESFTSPTISVDIKDYLNEPTRKYFPNSLARKVYVITPKLAVALAGDEIEMKNFLNGLRSWAKYDDVITKELLNKCLSSYNLNESFKESAFLMILIEDLKDNKIEISTFTSGKWKQTETEIFETIAAKGSGTTDFLFWAAEKGEFRSSLPKENIGHAIQSNTGLIARLLAIEIASLWNISNNWGAGFELAFYNYDHFTLFSEIAYVLYEAHYDEQGGIGDPYPAKIMYYKYYGEELVITSIDMNRGILEHENEYYVGQATECNTQVFQVSPLDEPSEFPLSEIVSDLSFSTYRIAAGFIIKKNNKKLFIPSFFNEGPETHITYVPNKSLVIKMHEHAIKEIRNAALKAFSNL